IFRVAHSLKGNATSLELSELAGFAHVVEDLLDVFREQQALPSADVISLLLKAVDELRAMLSTAAAGQRELTPGQHELRKEIAREVEKRSKRVVTASGAPGESGSAGRGDTLPNSGHRTLRADVDKLDHMLNLTGEIVIAQGRLRQMIEELGTEQGRAILEMHRDAERLYMDLQSEVMGIRMVPVGPVFRQFVRSVRDLARSHGKLARLEVVGGNVVVKLEDDGAGFDRSRIVDKAKRLGLLSGKEELRDQDLYDLVFQAGFSTAESVTDLSGRGVGLDVVRRNIDILRGTVEVSSTASKGSTIVIRLPLTLAIIEGFSVRVGTETFVVPLEHVIECTELPAEQRSSEASGILSLRGTALPYVRLRRAFSLSGQAPKRENIVVVKINEFHAGIAVDELLGGMQAVVKPLGRAFRGVPGIAGSTVLGNGRVGLIIDVPSLLRGVMQSTLQAQA
ncbi:MAG: chemotaxis protein CheW, partial [Terriglobales bacterium]